MWSYIICICECFFFFSSDLRANYGEAILVAICCLLTLLMWILYCLQLRSRYYKFKDTSKRFKTLCLLGLYPVSMLRRENSLSPKYLPTRLRDRISILFMFKKRQNVAHLKPSQPNRWSESWNHLANRKQNFTFSHVFRVGSNPRGYNREKSSDLNSAASDHSGRLNRLDVMIFGMKIKHFY